MTKEKNENLTATEVLRRDEEQKIIKRQIAGDIAEAERRGYHDLMRPGFPLDWCCSLCHKLFSDPEVDRAGMVEFRTFGEPVDGAQAYDSVNHQPLPRCPVAYQRAKDSLSDAQKAVDEAGIPDEIEYQMGRQAITQARLRRNNRRVEG